MSATRPIRWWLVSGLKLNDSILHYPVYTSHGYICPIMSLHKSYNLGATNRLSVTKSHIICPSVFPCCIFSHRHFYNQLPPFITFPNHFSFYKTLLLSLPQILAWSPVYDTENIHLYIKHIIRFENESDVKAGRLNLNNLFCAGI